jgi:uncharacterized membrane protein YjjP (DUF1212 family)
MIPHLEGDVNSLRGPENEEIEYFEPLPVGMAILGVLTKIAALLGIINGVIFFVPGILAFYLQQYLYRSMDDKSSAVILAAGMMVTAWLFVILELYGWYLLLFAG